jgi:N-ethylmaleimide reductase
MEQVRAARHLWRDAGREAAAGHDETHGAGAVRPGRERDRMSALFRPLRLGALDLSHRIVMAPLTRLRNRRPGDLPHALHAEYYGQRASAGGLLITEATAVAPAGLGYPGAPGIHTPEQVAAWRAVVQAVHAKGGRIAAQLWHGGRISHSSLQPGGGLPVAPSAIAAPGLHVDAEGQPTPFETPRALAAAEIAGVVAGFREAALNARAAGFDAVEIHGANGYLIDQFLRDGTNRRTDAYGGVVANRLRFLLEVVDAVAGAWDPARVGVRLSPWGRFNGMADSDSRTLFGAAARALGRRGLAWLHLVEPRADWTTDEAEAAAGTPDAAALFGPLFGGPVIDAGGFTREAAERAIAEGRADAVAFGRLFIANPDLPERFRRRAPLNPYHRPTFYEGGACGYTDYPSLAEAEAA